MSAVKAATRPGDLKPQGLHPDGGPRYNPGMIKNLLRHGLPALTLAVLPFLATADDTTAISRNVTTPASAGAPDGSAKRAPVPLFEAIDRLPVAEEHREGYKRDLYKHWNKGLNAADGCATRKEVILGEAVLAPQVASGCKLSGGSWRSAYYNVVVSDAARLDVDHFVPLAEVYDSK
ncbi:hypothetical protein ACIPY6_37235 [Streptomyces sp. NPDC090054]|uniref:hypothetical protein n=1 Tax=Streptomyces sp. NPDC090054 TaxID=3365933 RepID=UPI00382F6DA6